MKTDYEQAQAWKWAGFVWGYALIWFLINDRIKLLAYRIFDPVKAATKRSDKDGPEPGSKTAPKPESKPEVKDDSKIEAKVQPKPEAPSPPEVTPQLAKRVHALYEELGREEVKAVQDWEKANQQTRKDAPDEAHK